MWFNGTYGSPGHERPRWKCVPRNGDRPHRFTEPLPRQVAHAGYCTSCERAFDPREGPVTPRAYAFAVKQVAQALVAVGAGASYRQAAEQARTEAHRHPRDRRSAHGQLVADWVEVFAPVVFEPHRPSSWPKGTLLLDEQVFRVRRPDRRQGGDPAFTILGAYGYEGGGQGFWRLEGFPATRRGFATSAVMADVWAGFLRSLSGEPERVVCDRDATMLTAIERTWPQADVWICQWHLRRKAQQLLYEFALTDPEEPIVRALEGAFESLAAWEEFKRLARGLRRRELKGWLKDNEALIESQLGRRPAQRSQYPLSTGALEERLRAIEHRLEWRAGRMTNRQRLNHLLLLFQLELNGQASEPAYAKALRDWLAASGGRPRVPRRAIADLRGEPSLRA